MINLIGLIFLALFGFLGYRRGILRMAASLIALVVAGLLAQPLSGLGAVFVPSNVPKIFHPAAGALLAGLGLFVLADLLLGYGLKRQATQREEAGLPKVLPWEAYSGGVLGACWGVIMLTIVLGGISAIGRAQRVVRRSDAQVAYRLQHPGPWGVVDDAHLTMAPAEVAESWTLEVEESVFSPLVRKVNPIDDKVEKTLTDLSVVCNDASLYRLFQGHPKVRQFTSDPKFAALAQDPEIAKLIQEGNYRGLMDNDKIGQLAADKATVQQLKSFHIDQVLEEIRKQSQSLPQERVK